MCRHVLCRMALVYVIYKNVSSQKSLHALHNPKLSRFLSLLDMGRFAST